MPSGRRRKEMIGNISSASANTNVQQFPTVHNVASPLIKGTPSNEDTVQLSTETQQHLSNTKAPAQTSSSSINQIIKEAADGDIAALAKLALVG